MGQAVFEGHDQMAFRAGLYPLLVGRVTVLPHTFSHQIFVGFVLVGYFQVRILNADRVPHGLENRPPARLPLLGRDHRRVQGLPHPPIANDKKPTGEAQADQGRRG